MLPVLLAVSWSEHEHIILPPFLTAPSRSAKVLNVPGNVIDRISGVSVWLNPGRQHPSLSILGQNNLQMAHDPTELQKSISLSALEGKLSADRVHYVSLYRFIPRDRQVINVPCCWIHTSAASWTEDSIPPELSFRFPKMCFYSLSI